MYAVLAEESLTGHLGQQWMTKPFPPSMHTDCIPKLAILFNYMFHAHYKSFVCMCTNEENVIANEAIVFQ